MERDESGIETVTAQGQAAEPPGGYPVPVPATAADAHPATQDAGHPAGGQATQSAGWSAGVASYGPGVPAQREPEPAAIRRTGAPPRRQRARTARRLLGIGFTVVLLAASGVLFYLRFDQAPALRVSGVSLAARPGPGCSTVLTGQITTNGASGAVAYQWLFLPQAEPPVPLSQPASAGRRSLDVTVTIQGSGSGSASQQVVLEVLSPQPRIATATAIIQC